MPHIHKEYGLRFPPISSHHSTCPTQRTVLQMPPQGVMTSEQANYCPGLRPVEGRNFGLGSQTRSTN
jgi:hypothetical protein